MSNTRTGIACLVGIFLLFSAVSSAFAHGGTPDTHTGDMNGHGDLASGDITAGDKSQGVISHGDMSNEMMTEPSMKHEPRWIEMSVKEVAPGRLQITVRPAAISELDQLSNRSGAPAFDMRSTQETLLQITVEDVENGGVFYQQTSRYDPDETTDLTLSLKPSDKFNVVAQIKDDASEKILSSDQKTFEHHPPQPTIVRQLPSMITLVAVSALGLFAGFLFYRRQSASDRGQSQFEGSE